MGAVVELMTIGEFAVGPRLWTKALRLYDGRGVLRLATDSTNRAGGGLLGPG
ncbi:MAG: hypothetical protein ACLP62_12935 [Acidimicrobiales bacterium]